MVCTKGGLHQKYDSRVRLALLNSKGFKLKNQLFKSFLGADTLQLIKLSSSADFCVSAFLPLCLCKGTTKASFASFEVSRSQRLNFKFYFGKDGKLYEDTFRMFAASFEETTLQQEDSWMLPYLQSFVPWTHPLIPKIPSFDIKMCV